MPGKCRGCQPVLDGMRADVAPFRTEAKELPRLDTGKLVSEAFERGQRAERARCADVALLYPLENFAYAGDTGELLRLRDAISQAIEKMVPVGQSIL